MSGFAWIGARRAWARAGHVLGLSAGFALPALATTIERVTSPGGIEAWLVREPSLPLIAMEFAFHGGSRGLCGQAWRRSHGHDAACGRVVFRRLQRSGFF